jgi:transposase
MRLFFRYRETKTAKIIILAWVNDEQTLRAYGKASDAYAVSGLISQPSGRAGKPVRIRSIPGGSFLSMKPGRRPTMAPLRGWSLRGQRIEAKAPYGPWKTMTFLAALRHDRIDAPWVVDGPINGELFRLYVEKVLAPALKPGDMVILDNLGSHKSQAVRAAIRAAGARLFFLPPSSPDLNPIDPFGRLRRSSPTLRRLFQQATLAGTLSRLRSNTSCARPPSALSRRLGNVSALCSIASHQMNAKPTSPMPDMLPTKIIPL